MEKEKILVVDDEAAILMLFETAFTRYGYQVITTESANEALSLLKNEKIMVMFLDLNMPEMDGVKLCREIRKDHPMSIIFAITGHPSLFELADCRDAGFDDYFKKPVDLATLKTITQEAFDKIKRWKKV